MSLVGEAYRRSQGHPEPVRPEGEVTLSRRKLSLIIAATAVFTSLSVILLNELRSAPDSFELTESALSGSRKELQTSVDALVSTNETIPNTNTNTNTNTNAALVLNAAGGRDRLPSANSVNASEWDEPEDQRVQDLYRARALDLSRQEEKGSRSEPPDSRVVNAGSAQVFSGSADVSQASVAPAQNEPAGDSGIGSDAILQQAQKLLLAEPATRASSLPTIEELPEADRDRIPTLLYSAHDFQPKGESRVMINREWYSVGERLTSRLILREIRKSDIVVESDDGFRVIVPALASWVNL
jgi:hypothetical protein